MWNLGKICRFFVPFLLLFRFGPPTVTGIQV